MMREIREFWNGTEIEDMLRMTQDAMVSKLQGIVAEHSNAQITITIREDSVWFEKLDERNRAA